MSSSTAKAASHYLAALEALGSLALYVPMQDRRGDRTANHLGALVGSYAGTYSLGRPGPLFDPAPGRDAGVLLTAPGSAAVIDPFDVGSVVANTNGYGWSVWVKTTMTARCYVFGGVNASFQNGFALALNMRAGWASNQSAVSAVHVGNTGHMHRELNATSIHRSGEWVHFAACFAAGTLQFWVNAQRAVAANSLVTSNLTAAVAGSTPRLGIGATTLPAALQDGGNYTGEIAHASVHSLEGAVWTDEQVLRLYEAGHGLVEYRRGSPVRVRVINPEPLGRVMQAASTGRVTIGLVGDSNGERGFLDTINGRTVRALGHAHGLTVGMRDRFGTWGTPPAPPVVKGYQIGGVDGGSSDITPAAIYDDIPQVVRDLSVRCGQVPNTTTDGTEDEPFRMGACVYGGDSATVPATGNNGAVVNPVPFDPASPTIVQNLSGDLPIDFAGPLRLLVFAARHRSGTGTLRAAIRQSNPPYTEVASTGSVTTAPVADARATVDQLTVAADAPAGARAAETHRIGLNIFPSTVATEGPIALFGCQITVPGARGAVVAPLWVRGGYGLREFTRALQARSDSQVAEMLRLSVAGQEQAAPKLAVAILHGQNDRNDTNVATDGAMQLDGTPSATISSAVPAGFRMNLAYVCARLRRLWTQVLGYASEDLAFVWTYHDFQSDETRVSVEYARAAAELASESPEYGLTVLPPHATITAAELVAAGSESSDGGGLSHLNRVGFEAYGRAFASAAAEARDVAIRLQGTRSSPVLIPII